jgi:glycosyltransferase involved in cell wall biosynthesis
MNITKLTIIFPVFNEKKSIENVLIEWINVLNNIHIKYEIIICEDGSTDGTSELLKILAPKYGLTLNQSKFRRGYGGAVISGILNAKYNDILSVDSDGQCDPRDINKFVKNNIHTDVIIGKRIVRSDTFLRILYSKLFGLYFNLLFPCKINDPSTPYIIFKKKQFIPLIKYLKLLREGFWWGFVATCVKFNISISEVPVNHRNRLDGNSSLHF